MAYLLHQLLTETASRLPHQEAVRFQGEGLSYSRLDNLTNQVARSLWVAGVQRGDRVGIYVNKSLASVISIFGILKAGGVYVPLDPNAPAKRNAYIVRDCGIQVLLISADKLPYLTEFYSEGAFIESALLLNDRQIENAELPDSLEVVTWDRIEQQSGEPVQPAGVIETDLAYILYTSGSTGDPKGVMISHRTIFTFINWGCDIFQIGPADRVTSHAPLHFDLSTFDIFTTTKAGGTIVLVPEKLSVFPVRLVQLFQKERITITYLVPSILSMMVNYGKIEDHDLSSLRLVLFAGEVFPIKYLRKLVSVIPDADYYNLYGPTETNVCTYYKVQIPKDIESSRTRPVPIGIACENMEVFAVDEQGQIITERGVEGELWVRGSCVAQGYWGDAEKTAKGFVRNPFQPHFDEIAYRTGDIVVLDDDGVNWNYIGRRDHMVKSRGYRIELGEIETALYAHGSVKEAAVIAIPHDLIGNRIKAYIVQNDNSSLSVQEVRDHCKQRLPNYMVPESVEFMDGLPKTSTGKTDRPSLVRMSVTE